MAADGSSNLEIIISAVDEASAAIEEVNASMSSMAESADAANSTVDAAMEQMNGVLTTATSDIELNNEEVNAGFARMANQVQLSVDSTQASYDEFMASSAAAAEQVGLSQDDIQAQMVATGQTAAEVAAEIQAANASTAVSSEETAAAVDLTKGSFTSIGALASGIGLTALVSGIQGAVSAAKQWDMESQNIASELKNIGSSIPLSQVQDYAQHIQSVTLLSQQQALQSQGIILGFKDLAPSYQTLTMLSADLATKMSQTSGTMAENLPNATKLLSNALNDPVAALNQLIKNGGVDLSATTVTMIDNMAKLGNTAGAQALLLKALSDQIGGMAHQAALAPGAGLTQLSNQIGATGQTIGQALLPDLDILAKALIPIIQDIGNWVQAHPKLTEAIVASVIAFTALVAVLSVIGIIVAAVGSSFAAFGLGIAAVVALLVGVIVANWTEIKTKTEEAWNFISDVISLVIDAISALIGLDVALWEDIFTIAWGAIRVVTEDVWGVLKAFFTDTWNWVKNLFSSSLDFIGRTWSTAWQGVSDFLSNIWTNIKNTVKSGFDDIINAINGFINALDAIHISLPSISIPGTKLSTPSLNLGFNIPNIPMLADGGFVTSPTLAIIGEAGPEAVIPLSAMGTNGAGGAMQIVVNINGGIFPADPSSIRQIGNILAKSVVQNLRSVKNYAL
jgi:hypothetical protein